MVFIIKRKLYNFLQLFLLRVPSSTNKRIEKRETEEHRTRGGKEQLNLVREFSLMNIQDRELNVRSLVLLFHLLCIYNSPRK